MATKAKKKTTSKAPKKVHPLKREIPVLHSLVIVLYILLAICFIAIYFRNIS